MLLRKRSHVGIGLGCQIQVAQDLIDPCIVPAQAEITRLYPQRFADGEKRIEHELLRHDAEQPPRVAIVGAHVVPEYARAAAVGAGEPRENGNQRSLAGAVGPEQAEEFTFAYQQIDAGQRLDRAEAARNIDDFDGGAHHAASIRRFPLRGFRIAALGTWHRARGCRRASDCAMCQRALTRAFDAKSSTKSGRFHRQELLDTVELSERSQARRKMREHQRLALGVGAPFPRQQQRDAGRVDGIDPLEIDHAERREAPAAVLAASSPAALSMVSGPAGIQRSPSAWNPVASGVTSVAAPPGPCSWCRAP